MTAQVIINTHEATNKHAEYVQRRHYTVAQLIAELQKYDEEATVIIKNLNTGKYGSINFRGVTTEA